MHNMYSSSTSDTQRGVGSDATTSVAGHALIDAAVLLRDRRQGQHSVLLAELHSLVGLATHTTYWFMLSK